MNDDDEKEAKVIQLRVLTGGGGGGTDPHTSLAAHMLASQRRAEVLAALEHFKQLALTGEVEMIAIAAKMKPPPFSNGEVSTIIQPSGYNRFEIMGILHAMLSVETQKLTVQRMMEPVTDPTKPGA